MTIESMNPTTRRFEIGNVLTNMSRAVGQNWMGFFGLSLLLQGLPAAVVGYFQAVVVGNTYQPGATSDPSQILGVAGFLLIGLLVGIISSSVLQATISFGVIASLRGRTTTFSECLASGLRYFPRALGIGFLCGLAIIAVFIVGSILIIVGAVLAVIMALAWSIAVPVAVAEDKGVLASISRSGQITNGYKGQIFLLFLIYVVVYWVLSMLGAGIGASLLSLGMQSYLMVSGVIISPLLASAAAVFSSAGVSAIYYELRSSRDGVGIEDMAAVFE